MKPRNINWPDEGVAEFCRRWKVLRLELFGSVLRDDFRPDSDVDVLATFQPDASWSLFDYVDMEDELSAILGRKVDFVSRRAIERSENWIRRENILKAADTVWTMLSDDLPELQQRLEPLLPPSPE
jgi:predicted nucleotidyltransferase